MALRYTPNPKAVELAKKALGMKISIQACVDHVNEERDKYQERLTFLMRTYEDKKLRYATDDSVTDTDIERIEQFEDLMGTTDVEEQLDKMFGGTDEGLESLRQIDGMTLADVDVHALLDASEAPDTIKYGLAKIIDIALWQAHALLEFDTHEDAYLVNEAADVIRDRLGLPLS